jgi:phosphoglycerol geranylgeranyltransferase
MRNEIYRNILLKREQKHKMLAVLLDPDKCKDRHIISIISMLKSDPPDFVFVGGSHTILSTNSLIELLKDELSSKIVLFPGNASQFSEKADALLFLSLLSGRNPEYLIGQHVNSAIGIKESGVEVIPTAYILIEGGSTSAVEYMSNTRAIPRNKKDIAVSTAVAGELLGMHLTYLEAGSGAQIPVPGEMIQAVRWNLDTPLIVGGGIRTPQAMINAFEAGADLVVIGNIFEAHPELIAEFAEAQKAYNEKTK